MKTVKLLLTLLFAITTTIGCAQTVISAGSQVKIKGTFTTAGSISNSSDKTDLSETQLILNGTNQTISSTSPISVQSVTLEGGNKTSQGEWTITQSLIFTQGVITPASGKILYVGTTTLNGITSSFVNGPLSQKGGGTRFYPIGSGSVYMPMSLNNVQDAGAEIKVERFTSGANLTLPQDLSSIATNRYWQLSATGGSATAASASLYIPGSSVDAAPKLVVVQAENSSGSTAINIGGGISGDFVTSFSAVDKPVLTIGVAEKVDIQIHDLITPFNADNINDQLKVVNIQYAVSNKVTLLDRWGVVAKEWKDFRNYDDPNNPNNDNFDFSKLSPGNYICVLEYQLTAGGPTEKISQMITVLK